MSAGAVNVSDSWRIASDELQAFIMPPEGCRFTYDMRIGDAAMMFPEMPVDEFKEFVEDIRVAGMQDTIKVSNGEIVDGRHRYWACIVLGIDPRLHIEAVDLSSEEVDSYVWSYNAKRRHLTKQSVALVAAKRYERLAAIRAEALARNEEIRKREEERIRASEEERVRREKEKAKENAQTSIIPASVPEPSVQQIRSEAKAIADAAAPVPKRRTAKALADEAGISDRLVKLSKELYSIGSKPLVSMVQAGQLSLKSAINFAKACPVKTKQNEICKEGVDAVLGFLKHSDGKPKDQIDLLAEKHGVKSERARELVQKLPQSIPASSADIEQIEPVETALSRLFEKYRASEIVSGALTLARLAPLGDRLDVGQEMQKFSQVFGVIVSSIDDETLDDDAEMGDVTGF